MKWKPHTPPPLGSVWSKPVLHMDALGAWFVAPTDNRHQEKNGS